MPPRLQLYYYFKILISLIFIECFFQLLLLLTYFRRFYLLFGRKEIAIVRVQLLNLTVLVTKNHKRHKQLLKVNLYGLCENEIVIRALCRKVQTMPLFSEVSICLAKRRGIKNVVKRMFVLDVYSFQVSHCCGSLYVFEFFTKIKYYFVVDSRQGLCSKLTLELKGIFSLRKTK